MKDKIDKRINFREKDFRLRPWQLKVQEVIYGTDTRTGRIFDIVLLIVILLSIILVMLESIRMLNAEYSFTFWTIEWVVTLLFTIEYVLRVVSLKKPLTYFRYFLRTWVFS